MSERQAGRVSEELEQRYLVVGEDPVLCRLSPAAGAARETAVLLCPPFGWDEMCSYRSRRAWAEDLARRGYSSLRFDLPGTGDSGGGPERGLVPSWTAAVGAGAEWLRQTTNVPRIAAVGIGLGSLLAWCAAAGGAGIDDLVLWGMPLRGRSLVRELRAFARLEEVPPGGNGTGGSDGDGDRGLVSGGFRMSGETVAALERMDVAALPVPGASRRRILLLGRDGMAVDRDLLEVLAQTGAEVEVVAGDGYGAMMATPQVARAPLAVFDGVAGWLEAGERERGADVVAALRLPRVDAHERGEMVVDGVPIRELSLAIAQPFGRMRGILAEPTGGAAGAPLCAVLLNAGAQRRIGPNRMWVEIARRWAARGVPALRLDVAGIGDSDGETLTSEDDAVLYVPEYVDQVLAALDALAERGLPPRFLLLGLCSGAYWAFHAAARDERVVAVAMLNPRALMWDPSLHVARDARKLRKLGQLRTWRKVIRHDGSLTSPLTIARAQALRPFVAISQRQQHHAAETELDCVLDGLRERGVTVAMAFSGSEPVHEELARSGRLARLAQWPNVSVEELARGPETHTLRAPELQRRAHDAVDRALDRALRDSVFTGLSRAR